MWADGILYLAPVVSFWVFVDIRQHQLVRHLAQRYPQEAHRKIRYAFSLRRHPSKSLYWVSNESADFLVIHDDHELLAERRTLLRLFSAAIAAPFLALFIFGAMATIF